MSPEAIDRRYFIYALACPATGDIRYVGKTIATISVRISSHRAEARKGRPTHVYTWWRKVCREHGREPIPVQLEEGWGAASFVAERERDWIALYRSNGLELTNLTDGGEGVPGLVHSEETRKRISASKKGQPQREEDVARRAESNRGQKRTPEAVARMRAARTYVAHDVATKQKMSAAAVLKWERLPEHHRDCEHCRAPFVTKGSRTYCTEWCHKKTTRPPRDPADDGRRRPLSENHRDKIAEALRGRDTSAETRLRLSRANRGRTHSDQSRANMSAAHLGKFSKVSPALLVEIRQRHAGVYGETARLAREYGLDPSYLGKLLKGKFNR